MEKFAIRDVSLECVSEFCYLVMISAGDGAGPSSV